MSNTRSAAEYLQALAIEFPTSPTAYWNHAEKVAGESFVTEVKKAIDEEDRRVYRLLDSSAAAALAAVPLLSPAMPGWLAFIEAQALPGGTWLDVGCGPGIQTCYPAWCDESRVVTGIDVYDQPIAAANEIARKLGLTNVAFQVKSAADLKASEGGGAEVVTSSMVLHEMDDSITLPRPVLGPLLDAVEHEMRQGKSRYAKLLAGQLADGGTLISMERLPGMPAICRWIASLGKAGVGVDLSRSAVVAFTYVLAPAPERVPILLATKGEEVPSAEAVLGWLQTWDYAASPD